MPIFIPDCGAKAPCCGVHSKGHCACNTCFCKYGTLVFHPTCEGFIHARLKPAAPPPETLVPATARAS